MLTIDRLRLQLPNEYQDRAQLIAQLLTDQLAEIPLGMSRKIERLSLAPITLAPGLPDQQLAREIAAAVQIQLGGRVTTNEGS